MNGEVDLGTLVARLSEHPELIESIRALVPDTGAPREEVHEERPHRTDPLPFSEESRRRRRVIESVKPYLTERRAKAADALLLIAEILDRLPDEPGTKEGR